MCRFALVFLLALSALAPATGAVQPRESRDWKRIRTGELTVVGNAGPAELQRERGMVAKDDEYSGDSAPYTAFLASLSYRKLSQPENAQKVLSQIEGAIMPATWTEQVLLFLQGKSTADQFLRKAKTRGEQTEAHVYIGILLSIAGDRAGAAEHLGWVKERGSTNFVEHGLSLAELEQLTPANR